MRNCPEMKEGMVDFKINDVKERIAKRDGQKPPTSGNTSGSSSLTSYKQCPDGNHPHLIDLGLPSGTKWACCNMDAKKPEDYGGYYAWGETTTKSKYTWENYKHCDGTEETCKNLGASICGTQYDVAHVKWGGSWQLPTKTQIAEMIDKCKYEETVMNGVKGHKYTGPNGASIFLPFAGLYSNILFFSGKHSYYWSGTPSSPGESYNLFQSICSSRGNRCGGQSVRPVAR